MRVEIISRGLKILAGIAIGICGAYIFDQLPGRDSGSSMWAYTLGAIAGLGLGSYL